MRAANILEKIDPSNKTAIAALSNLIRSSNDESTLRMAANILEEILQKEQMPKVVSELKDHLNDENWENKVLQYLLC
ncbi:MAG: hypothetical protein QNJ33_20825 [Crocosphaera sp.]|nr:hypothetical protein [Crocosphaera sp.]